MMPETIDEILLALKRSYAIDYWINALAASNASPTIGTAARNASPATGIIWSKGPFLPQLISVIW